MAGDADGTDGDAGTSSATDATGSDTLAWLADAGLRAHRAPEAAQKARYRIIGEIGRGGMGRVLEAEDTQFGRRVALKELHGAACESDEARRRFTLEALVTANLEHPGVVPVIERGLLAGKPFYTMRRVEGRPLSALLAERKSLEARLPLLSVVIQVAHTLGYAHAHGVVHRDVKPANVMVGHHGEAVLLDWGIARVSGAGDEIVALSLGGDDANLTVDGAVLGTPAYMAPEQARGDTAAIDARTDVFALGALLYHTLAGRAPYAGDSVAALVTAAQSGITTPLHELAPEVPGDLVHIVDKAMATNPAERYATAAELASALEAFQAGAVLQRPVRWLGTALGALIGVALAGFVGMIVSLGQVSSTIKQQGLGGLGVLGFAAVSAVLALTEWRTARRYRLAPIVLAFGIATVLLGIANAVGGLSLAMSATFEQKELPANYMLMALYEVGGSVVLGCLLGALQIVAWALCSRMAPAPPGESARRRTRR